MAQSKSVVTFVKWHHLAAVLASRETPPCFHILDSIISRAGVLSWRTRCGIEWERQPSIEAPMPWASAYKLYQELTTEESQLYEREEEICVTCWALQILESGGLP